MLDWWLVEHATVLSRIDQNEFLLTRLPFFLSVTHQIHLFRCSSCQCWFWSKVLFQAQAWAPIKKDDTVTFLWVTFMNVTFKLHICKDIVAKQISESCICFHMHCFVFVVLFKKAWDVSIAWSHVVKLWIKVSLLVTLALWILETTAIWCHWATSVVLSSSWTWKSQADVS